MLFHVFTILYMISVSCLSLYGLQALILSVLFLRKRNNNSPIPSEPQEWPSVTVQLPIYNEKYVVKRLLDSISKLDYPSGKLSIQVLDDSTDETTRVAAKKVKYYRGLGINITLLHRKDRSGYKAGALAAALPTAEGDLIAIFDADFIPPQDFLRRLVPDLAADPRLGMVQARWEHLNADYNLLTHSQALMLDGHFVVEQTARSRSGLLFNFNGSGGIWRKECIIDSGGWQSDTLAEDLDLSYRAQLNGWRIAYVPNVVIPGELPAQIAAFKQQQYRWTRGGIQVLRKSFIWLLTSKQLSIEQRLMAFLQLSGYLSYPLILLALISSLPVTLDKGLGIPYLPWLALAGLGGPVLFILSQATTYRDWLRRLVYLPILLLLRMGLSFNNTRAVIDGFKRQSGVFERTPKFSLESRRDSWQLKKYRLHLELDIIVELLLAAYSAIALNYAIHNFVPLSPALIMFSLGFIFTGITGWAQSMAKTRQQKSQTNPTVANFAEPAQQPIISPPFRLPIY